MQVSVACQQTLKGKTLLQTAECLDRNVGASA